MNSREQRLDLGRRLVGKYRELGWTQEQLATAAHLSPRAVSAFVRGETAPNESTLDAIATAIGATVDPDDVRASWPDDVRFFLDLMGVWLMARPANERRHLMQDLARQVAESA